MPKVTSPLAAALLIAGLLLAGCAGPAPEVASEPQREPAASEASTPLAAESPAPAPATSEATFLATVRGAVDATEQIPEATDEQLLAAGVTACEQLASGADVFGVRVIEGETPDPGGYYRASTAIAAAAETTICTS